MISKTYRNTLYASGLIATVIVIPDLLGLFFELIHLVFELILHVIHLLFEALESTLDHAIEHAFETDLHETQVIVFYIIMAGVAIPAFFVCRALWRLLCRVKRSLFTTCVLCKNQAILYRQSMPIAEKIKVMAIAMGVIYLASFVVI